MSTCRDDFHFIALRIVEFAVLDIIAIMQFCDLMVANDAFRTLSKHRHLV